VWEATDWHQASDEFTIHPADREWVMQALEAAIAHRSELEIEYRLLFPDQSTAWVLSRGQVVRAAGKATHFFGITLDITPRKRAELTIRERENQLCNLAANLPGGIFQYALYPDGSDQFLYVSPGCYDLYEVEAATAKLSGQAFWERVHADDVDRLRQAIQTSAQTLQPWDFTWCISLPSGTVRWLQSQGQPTRQEDGTVMWDGLIIDVSDRKTAELSLRQNEATTSAIIQALPDLLLQMDGEGTYLQVFKDEGIRLINPNGIYVGASLLDNLPPAIAEERIEYIRHALATHSLQVYEYALPFEDETRYEEARIVPIEENTVLIMVRDISDRKRAEIALRQQEAYFRSLFDQASVGIAVCDRAGRLTRVNQRYCDLLGYDPAELVGHDYEELTFAGDRDTYKRAMQALESGKAHYFALEKRYLRKDGSTVWVHITCSAIHDDRGTHTFTLGIVQDISERKRTTAALKLSEQRFRAIFQNAAIGVVIETPPDYRLSLANTCYLQMLGYNSDELAQLTYRDITVPEDLERQDVFVAECFAGKRAAYQIEKRYIRKDGSHIWVNMVTSIVRNESGGIEYYISVVEDITDRKRAIALEISRHQELKEAIFDESNDAIFLVNPDIHLIVDCNRRAMALFEADRKEDLLNRSGNSFHKHPFTDEERTEMWAQMLSKTVWQRELEYLTLKGRSFWGLLSAKLIRVAEQQIVLVQITDISDRKQVELDIRRNMEDLQRLNEIKDDFLSTVSHELRSPLTSIDMAGRMIRIALEQQNLLPSTSENPAAEKIQHYLDILQDQCRQERELVNDLLDLQRLNADAYELQITEVNLPHWLAAITHDMTDRTQENQQQFELAIAPTVSTITTDIAVLRRILTELLNNACKYTPSQERIQLTVEALPNTLQFTVLNTGVTIAPEDLTQIFEPFFRASRGDRWSKRGTGLGLTLVKKFITCLQGTIHVTSDAQATRFIVQLPPEIAR